MCGIAGIANWNEMPSREIVTKMCDTISHRGPDGKFVKQFNGACLGHQRLSIIDLSSIANQPMSDVSRRYWIVFNGEIYGFNLLRLTLIKLGHQFVTSSDTEVILEGFKEWGIEGICNRLSGMFAFSIWDTVERTLYLARDRFGEKPLYYLQDISSFRFSSNLNSLFIDSETPKQLNPDGLIAFLNHSFCLPEYPIFKHVKALEPAHYLIAKSNGTIERKCYWKPVFEPKLNYKKEEWLEIIEEKIKKVIQDELISDVNIGVLLSGGVDSSLIASIATKLKPNIDLFTMRMPGSVFDESGIAKKIANKIGGKHHIIDAEPIDIDDFIKLQGQFSEPLGDSSAIGMWMVSKAARKHVTVVLTGDGGDELFAGYDTIKLNVQYNKFRKFTATPFGRVISNYMKKSMRGMSDQYFIRKVLTFSNLITHSSKDFHLNRTFLPISLEQKIYGDKLKNTSKAKHFYIQALEKIWESSNAKEPIDKILAYDLNHVLLGDFIPKVDVSTMFHSLEARAPFLHHHLADIAFQMPLEIKRLGNTQKGITKTILKKRLGEEVASDVVKGKRGFVIPVDKWLDNEWKGLVEELPNSKLVEEGYLDKKAVKQVIEGYKKYPNTYSRIRYSLVALNSWSKTNY